MSLFILHKINYRDTKGITRVRRVEYTLYSSRIPTEYIKCYVLTPPPPELLKIKYVSYVTKAADGCLCTWKGFKILVPDGQMSMPLRSYGVYLFMVVEYDE